MNISYALIYHQNQKIHDRIITRKMISFISSFIAHIHSLHSVFKNKPHCLILNPSCYLFFMSYYTHTYIWLPIYTYYWLDFIYEREYAVFLSLIVWPHYILNVSSFSCKFMSNIPLYILNFHYLYVDGQLGWFQFSIVGKAAINMGMFISL